MRSLAFKLTLSFLLVGVLGVAVFGILVARRTQNEFNQFLSARDQSILVNALTEYYKSNRGWENVTKTLLKSPPLDYYSRSTTLTDGEGKTIYQNFPIQPDTKQNESDDKTSRITLQDRDKVFGYLYVPASDNNRPSPKPGATPLEGDFVNRVLGAAITSAVIASVVALIFGFVLARTLTRPMRQLTTATRAMASGKLQQQVPVYSRDEIGELAQSFNQMSADLSHASQARKQMTADLAHDLRTPLSILRGYTEGLKEGRIAGSIKLYDIMHGEVEHLQRLVEDLRTLSLADASELTLNKRTIDPRALLERTALAYFMQAEESNIKLTLNAPENLPSISVDTNRMTQVLNNLVSNALRYTQQGEIELSARSNPKQVYLSVRDTGTGIAPADMPYVFDRFYRADKSRQRDTNDGDSSGLGLAIAKAIVEAHGGTISVQSEIDHGTTFTISVPLG